MPEAWLFDVLNRKIVALGFLSRPMVARYPRLQRTWQVVLKMKGGTEERQHVLLPTLIDHTRIQKLAGLDREARQSEGNVFSSPKRRTDLFA